MILESSLCTAPLTHKCLNYKRFKRLPCGIRLGQQDLAYNQGTWKKLGLWWEEGSEGVLQKLCAPVEKFRLYTWKQQDLEVVILYKKVSMTSLQSESCDLWKNLSKISRARGYA